MKTDKDLQFEAYVTEQAAKKRRAEESRTRELVDRAVRAGTIEGFLGVFMNGTSKPSRSDRTVYGGPMWKDETALAFAVAMWERDKEWQATAAEQKVERERAADEVRLKRETEQRLAARAQLLAPAKQAFMQSGGTADEWESQELTIEADIRSRLAADAAVDAATAGTPTAEQLRRQMARDF